MSRQLSSLFVGSAVVVAVLSGCADPDVEPPTPETAERRAALGFGFANTLAFPEYDLNALIPGALAHDRDANNIQEHIDAGWRLHDLSVWSTSPLRFSGAFVLNSGVYHQAGHGWAYDLTETDLQTIHADPVRRIVDIAQYNVGGQWRWAAVWVANTSDQQRDYKLLVNQTEPTFLAEATGHRVVSLEKGPVATCAPPCVPLQTYSSVMIENVPMTSDWRTQHIGRSDMAGLTALMGSPATACSDPGQNPAFSGSGNCRRRLAVIVQLTGDNFFYVTEEVPEDNGLYNVPMLGEGEQTWWASGLFWDEGNRHDPDSIWHVRARLGARPLRLRPYAAPEGLRYIATFAPSTEVFSEGTSDGNLVLQEVDEIVARHMRRMGVPGLTLGIVQGSRLVHAKGYGYSDLQNFHLTAPTDLFRIASISKVLAKAAMVRLMTTGASVTPPGGGVPVPVRLDTKPWGTVWSYDTDGITWHPNLGDITIGDLLTHQTGLRFLSDTFCDCNPTTQPDCDPLGRDVSPCNSFDMEAATPETWASIERSLGGTAFYHHTVPGDRQMPACPASMATPTPDPACLGFPYHYKNAHYHIIGEVIERVTGMTFDSYLRATFLDPLQLERLRVGKFEGTVACAVPQFPSHLFQAINYQIPLPYREDLWWDDRGDWVLCPASRYPASSYSASPTDLLRFATSIDVTAPGDEPLNAAGKAMMAALGGINHGGYLPANTVAELFEIPASPPSPPGSTTPPPVPESLKVAYAFNSDTIDGNAFAKELTNLLLSKNRNLPVGDLFPTHLQGCNPNAPFDAPVPAFTGTMNADGLAFEPDGRTAYVSGKVGNNYDIYIATRPTTNDPFNTPTLLGGISTPLDERAPSLLPSGAGLYVTYKSGGSADVAVAMKQAGNPPFVAPVSINGINSGVADQDPFWSTATGQPILFFASERPDGAHRDIYWTTPTSTGFNAPEKLAVINSDSEDYRPVLTADGLTLYFASSRTGIGGDTAGDILMATRPNTTANFGTPVNLWGLNTSGTEFPVNVSADGCTLYFASNDATNQQHFRLYQAKHGMSLIGQVTTRINIVGTGSVATAPFDCSTHNFGTCSAVGAAGTPMMVWADRPASWSGACVRNGANPSTDAVLVFTNNGVCTVTF